MKILNIDSYATTKRQISFAGQTYAVEEPSVQEFIDSLKASEELEKRSVTEQVMSESFEKAVATIAKAIPTLPEAQIRKLKLEAMSAVMRFIRGELDPDEETSTATVGAATPESEEKKPI